MKVKNVTVEELGNRIIVTSADGCRTEIHFDENGNQGITWIDTNAKKYKTNGHTWRTDGYNSRKVTVSDGRKHNDPKRVMFTDTL